MNGGGGGGGGGNNMPVFPEHGINSAQGQIFQSIIMANTVIIASD